MLPYCKALRRKSDGKWLAMGIIPSRPAPEPDPDNPYQFPAYDPVEIEEVDVITYEEAVIISEALRPIPTDPDMLFIYEKTLEQLDAWIEANVIDLVSARAALKRLFRVIKKRMS